MPEVVAAVNGDAPPGSLLANLRTQAAAQRETKTLDLPVGGAFGDSLIIRYGFLAIEDMDRYAELQPGNLRATSLTIDMMVSACRTVIGRDSGGVETDLGVKLDTELWQLLDWALPPGIQSADDITPREVVLALFGGNPMALVNHAERLITWFQDPSQAPGESSAAISFGS